MNLSGPIIIIENDIDEAMLIQELIEDLSISNTILYLSNSMIAIDYLKDCEAPFMILSAINLMGLNGFQLRDQILADKDLALKCTPFIFYAAHGDSSTQKDVYERHANGYFHNITSYTELSDTLLNMVEYWKRSTL